MERGERAIRQLARAALPALFAVVLFTGCRSDIIFSDNISMEGERWSRYNVPLFKADITDTLNAADMAITLRSGSAYPYRNIFLFVTTVAPGGESITDTLEYRLSDDHGNRLGRGFGDIRYLELPYRTNIYFPTGGTYTFRIEHAMRREEIEGIYDVGVKIRRQQR